MIASLSTYVALLGTGIVLVLLELFLPGGILGVLGALVLCGAAYVGATAFAAPWNLLAAGGVLAGSGIFFLLWVAIFPKSKMGKRIALHTDGSQFKAAVPNEALIGKTGKTLTALRPAGIAQVENRRVDVVAANGEWLPIGVDVRIKSVKGAVVTVVPLEERETATV